MIFNHKIITRTKIALAISSVLAVAELQANDEQIEVDIDRGELRLTLLEIGEAAGVEVVLPTSLTGKIKSSGLQGNYTLQDALEMALKDTGFSYEFLSDQTVVIKVDIEAAEEENAPEDVEEVVVTGSRLRNVNPTSPVTIITRQDIEAQGINNVEDIIRSLPQNVATFHQGSAINNSTSTTTLGTVAANLRGMGADGTLVLVNGKRMAVSTAFTGTNAVNLNTIPFSAIERVEVLTDGASAVYGSDAVAGVINFILRKDFDSPERTSLRFESSESGGDQLRFEQTFGTSWDAGNLTGSFSYQEHDPIPSAELGYTTRDLRAQGGLDLRIQDPFGFQPVPGTVFGEGVLVDLHDLCPPCAPPGVVFIPMPGPYLGVVDPNRDPSQPVTLADFSPANLIPYDRVGENQSDERTMWSFSARVEQEFADSLTGYVELNYARNESAASLLPLILQGVTVPTSNAFNNTGQELGVNYALDGESDLGMIPFRRLRNEARNTGIVLGVEADLPISDWKMEGYVNYSKEHTYAETSQTINQDALEAALADSNPDTALNLFGDGSQQNPNTVAGLFMVSGSPFSAPTSTDGDTVQVNLNANGSLFSLPGGDVSSALGVDYRTESSEFGGFQESRLPVNLLPERDTLAVFTELNIPLVGSDNSLPLVDSFEVRIAARWEEYSINGPFGQDSAGPDETVPNTTKKYSHTSPSIGFSWHLTPELKVRATFGESFKVARLNDLFGIKTGERSSSFMVNRLASQGIFNDPVSGLPLTTVPILTYDNGNSDLTPEISDTIQFGFDWTPSGVLEGFRVSASYNEAETEDVIRNSVSLILQEPEQFLLSNSVVRVT